MSQPVPQAPGQGQSQGGGGQGQGQTPNAAAATPTMTTATTNVAAPSLNPVPSFPNTPSPGAISSPGIGMQQSQPSNYPSAASSVNATPAQSMSPAPRPQFQLQQQQQPQQQPAPLQQQAQQHIQQVQQLPQQQSQPQPPQQQHTLPQIERPQSQAQQFISQQAQQNGIMTQAPSPVQTPTVQTPPVQLPAQQQQQPQQPYQPPHPQPQQQHMSPYASPAPTPIPPPQSRQSIPLQQSHIQTSQQQPQPIQHTFHHHTPVTMSASAGGQPPIKRQKLSPLPGSRPHTPLQQQQPQPLQRTSSFGPPAFQTSATSSQTHAHSPYTPAFATTIPMPSPTIIAPTASNANLSMSVPAPAPQLQQQPSQYQAPQQPQQQASPLLQQQQQQQQHQQQQQPQLTQTALPPHTQLNQTPPMSSMQTTFSMQPYQPSQPPTTTATTTAAAAAPAQPHAQAPPPPGSMGPPSRPVDKATDAAELTDVLASSGIDVKEEEAYLTNAYPTPTQPSSATAQATRVPATVPPTYTPGASVGAAQGPATGAAEGYSGAQPYSSDAHYTYQSQAGTPAPQQAEDATQQKPTAEALADEKRREDTLAARRTQYHLHNPFLQAQLIKDKIESRASELGVSWPSQGVYSATSTSGTGARPPPIEVVGPDGSSVVKTGGTYMQYDAPLVDILSLVSLACEERIRGVVEQASALARSRRANSHGIVAEPWKPAAASPPITGKEYKDDIEPYNAVTAKSRKLIDMDLKHEQARAAKRAKRNEDAIMSSIDGRKGSVGSDTMMGGVGDRASDEAPREKKVTKKDLKKAESKVSEAVQHQQAVETARMATSNLTSGSSFFGKKKYNWLSGAGGGLGATRTSFSTPSKLAAQKESSPSGAAARTKDGAGGKHPPTDKDGKAGGRGAGSAQNQSKEFGVFREDGERGLGIQTRDLLFVLEVDGKGMKVLQKGYVRDSREDYDRIQARDKKAD